MMNEAIFKDFIKNGYSRVKGRREWDVSDYHLVYASPELARGFLNLSNSPLFRKRVNDREVGLLRANSERVRHAVGNTAFNLIDLGCSDGMKVRTFLQSLSNSARVRYAPVHVNQYLIDKSLATIKKSKFPCVRDYKPLKQSSFDHFDEALTLLRTGTYSRHAVFLMDSTLARFEVTDFLFNLSSKMLRGDTLLIGNGIRTGRRLVSLSTYKHKAFAEWFIHLMRGLGFKDNEVEYSARFSHTRVECFFRIKVDKTVMHHGKKIIFKKGDIVVVAKLYKYYEHELYRFCEMYFPYVSIYKDKDDEYALIVCKK